jgi:hypothetical protein
VSRFFVAQFVAQSLSYAPTHFNLRYLLCLFLRANVFGSYYAGDSVPHSMGGMPFSGSAPGGP